MTHMRENRMIKTLPVHFPPWQIEQQEGKDQCSLQKKKKPRKVTIIKNNKECDIITIKIKAKKLYEHQYP